jgi:hypothetical protein
MFAPLAQYAVQIVSHDRLAEAQAARSRRLAREARDAALAREGKAAARAVPARRRFAPATSAD